MPERVRIDPDYYNYVAIPKVTNLSHVVLSLLVGNRALPPDILIRANIAANDNGGTYEQLVTQAVVASLEGTELPLFVTQPLPDAFIFISLLDNRESQGPHQMSLMSGDYHRLGTLRRLAREHDVNPNLMNTIWKRLVKSIRPELADEIDTSKAKDPSANIDYQYGHVIIRDEPMLEVYEDEEASKKLRRGLGRRSLVPLGYLLADNHMELYRQLDQD